MAIPKWVADMNRHVTNRLTGPPAARLPGFGVVVHYGRKSGRQYWAPVNIFRVPKGYVIALTYGLESQWVKNVMAAQGCELLTRGRVERLTHPRLFHDVSRSSVPAPVRLLLRLFRVSDFMELTRAGSEGDVTTDKLDKARTADGTG